MHLNEKCCFKQCSGGISLHEENIFGCILTKKSFPLSSWNGFWMGLQAGLPFKVRDNNGTACILLNRDLASARALRDCDASLSMLAHTSGLLKFLIKSHRYARTHAFIELCSSCPCYSWPWCCQIGPIVTITNNIFTLKRRYWSSHFWDVYHFLSAFARKKKEIKIHSFLSTPANIYSYTRVLLFFAIAVRPQKQLCGENFSHLSIHTVAWPVMKDK